MKSNLVGIGITTEHYLKAFLGIYEISKLIYDRNEINLVEG